MQPSKSLIRSCPNVRAVVAAIALASTSLLACLADTDAPSLAGPRRVERTERPSDGGAAAGDDGTGEDGDVPPVIEPPDAGDGLDPCAAAKLGDGRYCAESLDPRSKGKELYECAGGRTAGKRVCAHGCRPMPPGQNDVCEAAPGAPAPPLPKVTIDARGMYFSEASVRGPIESGLSYMLSRVATLAGAKGTVTPLTIVYRTWNNPYCGGFAEYDRTQISCPSGYPVQGNNQNYVVNITMHEIGHILAAQLFGSPAAAGRDLCENEGFASWIAGKYWMNEHPAVAVGSFREAALDDIARGRAQLSMSSCVSASDGWYTVYASFFEYLEKHVPNGVRNVATGAVSRAGYVAGWKAWMQQ